MPCQQEWADHLQQQELSEGLRIEFVVCCTDFKALWDKFVKMSNIRIIDFGKSECVRAGYRQKQFFR